MADLLSEYQVVISTKCFVTDRILQPATCHFLHEYIFIHIGSSPETSSFQTNNWSQQTKKMGTSPVCHHCADVVEVQRVVGDALCLFKAMVW